MPIPSKVGKVIAQATLPLALLILLTINPKLKFRPNVYLCVVSLLVVDATVTAFAVRSPRHDVPYLPARGVRGRAVAADAVVGPA